MDSGALSIHAEGVILTGGQDQGCLLYCPADTASSSSPGVASALEFWQIVRWVLGTTIYVLENCIDHATVCDAYRYAASILSHMHSILHWATCQFCLEAFVLTLSLFSDLHLQLSMKIHASVCIIRHHMLQTSHFQSVKCVKCVKFCCCIVSILDLMASAGR